LWFWLFALFGALDAAAAAADHAAAPPSFAHTPPSPPPTPTTKTTVLKAIEELKLRSLPDDALAANVRTLVAEHLGAAAAGSLAAAATPPGTATAAASPATPATANLLHPAKARQAAAHKDLASHYVLRLAYCRTPDLRAWLLQHESALFRARFRLLDAHQQAQFFAGSGLPYSPLPEDELKALRDDLAAVALSCGDLEGRNAIRAGERRTFYRVPFSAVPDLVAQRRVLIKGGFAYVGRDQVHSLVCGAFRQHLSAALADMARRWAAFAQAEGARLAPLVEAMPTRAVGPSDGGKAGKNGRLGGPGSELTAAQAMRLASTRRAPPCMTHMLERLATDHHLKHWGVQQLSLWLKAVGLPLEQALLFWRQQFAPRTPADKFQKEYAYTLRYNYGREGKRTDWSEWSCVRIIGHDASAGAGGDGACNGGCPFRTMAEGPLRALLGRMMVAGGGGGGGGCGGDRAKLEEAVAKAKGRHYQLACAAAFEAVHGAAHDTGINRPSDYYAAAVELEEARAPAAAEAGGGEGAAAGAGATAAGAAPAPAAAATAAV
jgi:DNA primase large subunit